MYLMIICPREVGACEHGERKYPPSERETLVKCGREKGRVKREDSVRQGV